MLRYKLLYVFAGTALALLTITFMATQSARLSWGQDALAYSSNAQSVLSASDDRAIDRVSEQQAKPVSNKTPMTPMEALGAFQENLQVKNGTDYFKDVRYVGAKACAACHSQEYTEWSRTWHAKMEQWPSAKTVIGEFDGQIITYKNVKVKSKDGKRSQIVTFQVRAFQKDGSYFYTVLDQDNARNNQTFKIEKTLGGKWDQGYEILVGKNYYPALLRYSNTGGGWLVKSFKPGLWVEPDGTKDGRPRRLTELPMHRAAEGKCAGCHTTAYDYKKDAKGVWQFSGNGQLGVGCEKCHGPGAEHIKRAETAKASGLTLARDQMKIVHGLKDLDFQQQNQLCAQCHGRASNRQDRSIAFPLDFRPGDMDITEKLVFWNYQSTYSAKQTKYFYRNNWAKRNRQQWQDHQLSKHFTKAGMSCLTCHTVHGKWKNMQLRMTPQKMCTSCHTTDQHAARPQTEMFAGSKMEQAGVQCINCHMARIGFRSHLTKATEKDKNFPMDGSSHHYLVPTPAIKKAFGVRTACEACHSKGRKMPDTIDGWVTQHAMDDNELDKRINKITADTRAQVDMVRIGLRSLAKQLAAKSLSFRKKAKIEQARANLNFVLLDGSMGFHNRKKAKAKLSEAVELLKVAGASFAVPDRQPPARQPAISRSNPVVASLRPAPTSQQEPIAESNQASTRAVSRTDISVNAKPPKVAGFTKRARLSSPASTKRQEITLVGRKSALRTGDSGRDVRLLQLALSLAGVYVTADAEFGRLTRRAVRKFQRNTGLPATGNAGLRTLAALAAATPTKDLIAKSNTDNSASIRAKINKIANRLAKITTAANSSATSSPAGKPNTILAARRTNRLSPAFRLGRSTVAPIKRQAALISRQKTTTILRFGDSGSQVRDLQKQLRNLRYKVVVDAQFGAITKRAVRTFQRQAGLQADGVVGPATRAALRQESSLTTETVSNTNPAKQAGTAGGPNLIE